MFVEQLDGELNRLSGGLVRYWQDRNVVVHLGEMGWQDMPFISVQPASKVIAWCRGQKDRAFEPPSTLRSIFGANRWTHGSGAGSRRVDGTSYLRLPGYHKQITELLAHLARLSGEVDPLERQWLDRLAEDCDEVETLAPYADWLEEHGHDDLAGLARERINQTSFVVKLPREEGWVRTRMARAVTRCGSPGSPAP